MSFELKIDEARALLRVRIHGILTFDEMCASRLEAANILQERNLKKLLVDLRELKSRERFKTLQCYEFGASYREAGIPSSTRIAHLLPRNPANVDNVKFITTVAFNRGVVAREFDDLEAAYKWLLESPA